MALSDITAKLRAANGSSPSSAPEIKASETTWDIHGIQDRINDTRDGLDQDHAHNLSVSIEAIGLIQPIVIDRDGILIVGGHRRGAILSLEERNFDRFEELFPSGQVPVYLVDFSAKEDPDTAFALEVAENEVRKDYTPEEVQRIAERLKGQPNIKLKGRPGEGQTGLNEALAAITGKSKRTIKRYLAQGSKGEKPKEELTPVQARTRKLTSVVKAASQWQQMVLDQADSSEDEKKMAQLLDELKAIAQRNGIVTD